MSLFSPKPTAAPALAAASPMPAAPAATTTTPAAAPAQPPRVPIGDVGLPRKLEHRGIVIVGTPGSGKTVAIMNMLDVIMSRTDQPGFITDRSSIYLQRYFNPQRGDVILNPADQRAPAWSPLAEFEDYYSAESLSKSIIPAGTGEGAEWRAYAQSILQSILEHAWENNLANKDIFFLGVAEEPKNLAAICSGTAAEGLFARGAEKMLSNARAILSTFLNPILRLDPGAGRSAFSIRQHIKSGAPGWLFFPYSAPQLKVFATLAASMADIWAEALMSLPPDENRRRWLVMDEFASLGKIASIEDFVTNARKYGGASILGMQNISQIEVLYGDKNVRTILSSLGNWLILRTADADTAEYLSRTLGDKQLSRYVHSAGSGMSGQTASNNESHAEQIVIERAVMPVEIMKQPDLQAIFNPSGAVPFSTVHIPLPQPRPASSIPEFIARPPWPRRAARDAAPVPAAATARAPTPSAALASLDLLDQE